MALKVETRKLDLAEGRHGAKLPAGAEISGYITGGKSEGLVLCYDSGTPEHLSEAQPFEYLVTQANTTVNLPPRRLRLLGQSRGKLIFEIRRR